MGLALHSCDQAHRISLNMLRDNELFAFLTRAGAVCRGEKASTTENTENTKKSDRNAFLGVLRVLRGSIFCLLSSTSEQGALTQSTPPTAAWPSLKKTSVLSNTPWNSVE